METISIDFIKENNVDQLIPLCGLHSEYERVPFDSKGKEEKLRQFLFKENPALFCLVAMKKKNCRICIIYDPIFNLGCL